jgi:hypothetical protein
VATTCKVGATSVDGITEFFRLAAAGTHHITGLSIMAETPWTVVPVVVELDFPGRFTVAVTCWTG